MSQYTNAVVLEAPGLFEIMSEKKALEIADALKKNPHKPGTWLGFQMTQEAGPEESPVIVEVKT